MKVPISYLKYDKDITGKLYLYRSYLSITAGVSPLYPDDPFCVTGLPAVFYFLCFFTYLRKFLLLVTLT